MKLHSIRDNRGILDFSQVDDKKNSLKLKVVRSSENLRTAILDSDFKFIYILSGDLLITHTALSVKDGLIKLSLLRETPEFKLTGVLLLIGYEYKIR